MTINEKQYIYELFKLYKERQYLVDTIIEYGPDHDFYLDIDTTAGKELEKVDQKIYDLGHKLNEEDESLFQDCQWELDNIFNKILEALSNN